jgi:hypothetical protein
MCLFDYLGDDLWFAWYTNYIITSSVLGSYNPILGQELSIVLGVLEYYPEEFVPSVLVP